MELQNTFYLFFQLLGNLKLVQGVPPSPTTFPVSETTKPPQYSQIGSLIHRGSTTPQLLAHKYCNTVTKVATK